MSALFLAFAVLAIGWANRRNECDDCGSQLLWCDPERSDVPLTRCFVCDGPHEAYVRKGYHDRYDFGTPGSGA